VRTETGDQSPNSIEDESAETSMSIARGKQEDDNN